MTILLLVIALCASMVGAITGIGGGIIVKPVVDAMGVLTVSTLSFLSGSMVLAMTSVSLLSGYRQHGILTLDRMIYLALGAVLGGILGKLLFDALKLLFESYAAVGIVQNSVLLVLTLIVLANTFHRGSSSTRAFSNVFLMMACGLVLGLLSAFLGIGGGPINLLALSYLFSMDTKAAAQHSLFIIFCSQLATLFLTLITKNVPIFETRQLAAMIVGGVSGALIGSKILYSISARQADRVFQWVLVLICLLSAVNVVRFSL